MHTLTGVFTRSAIKKGERITEYAGTLIGKERANQLKSQYKHTHLIALEKQHQYIDGLKQAVPGYGCASFVNDASYTPHNLPKQQQLTECETSEQYEHRPSFDNNTVFRRVWVEKLARVFVVLVAKRDIQPGEELFASYGKSYWKSFL